MLRVLLFLLCVTTATAYCGKNGTCAMCTPNTGCYKCITNNRQAPPDCVPDLETAERLCRVHYLEMVQKYVPELWETMDSDEQLRVSSLECQKGSPIISALRIVYEQYVQQARLMAMIDDFDKKFNDNLLERC